MVGTDIDRNLGLKICLPIEIKPQGGVNRFLENFINYLKNHNIAVTSNISDEYDILFANSWMVEYKDLLRVKRRLKRVKIVQRIDGSSLDYGGYYSGDKKQAKANLLADLTIFQSKYARYATTQKYKIISGDGPVIYNPVDINVFAPESKPKNCSEDIRIAYVTYSLNPKKGTGQLYKLTRTYPNLHFYLIGRYENPPLLDNLHLTGLLNKKQLAITLRSCQLLLFLSENETCSNVVLEALASGLPVLYKDSGGTKELVGECGLRVSEDNFYNQLSAILNRQKELSLKARQRVKENFSPEIIFPQYLKAISSCQRQPLPSFIKRIHFRLTGKMRLSG